MPLIPSLVPNSVKFTRIGAIVRFYSLKIGCFGAPMTDYTMRIDPFSILYQPLFLSPDKSECSSGSNHTNNAYDNTVFPKEALGNRTRCHGEKEAAQADNQ